VGRRLELAGDDHVKANPGQRMEEIVKGLGLETGLLQPLVNKARGTTHTVS
jgi:hypothetical protein